MFFAFKYSRLLLILNRYMFHMDSYNRVYNGARTYGERLESKLFKTILYVDFDFAFLTLICYREQTGKTHLLDIQADDLKEVDLAMLETQAIDEAKTEGHPVLEDK